MNPTGQIVRWESTADPLLCGIEVKGLPLRGPDAAGLTSIENPAFVLASLGSSRPADLALAISRASAAYSNARACLAVPADALAELDVPFLRERNIGVILDGVNETTPLSAVSSEVVEAIRFEPSFVARATKSGRLACVLDAMLSLAHDLGIATLGTARGPRSPSAKRFDFDYVSTRRN